MNFRLFTSINFIVIFFLHNFVNVLVFPELRSVKLRMIGLLSS